MKLPNIKLPVDDSKSPVTKSALIPFGIAWILIGIRTLYEPIYYFRGAYVDFTGHNLQVGIGLIIVGCTYYSCVFQKMIGQSYLARRDKATWAGREKK